jgi:hypothetical protein
LSNWRAIKCGVSWVSILGPLLFVTNISVLPVNMNIVSKLVLFVDDTSVLISASNIILSNIRYIVWRNIIS